MRNAISRYETLPPYPVIKLRRDFAREEARLAALTPEQVAGEMEDALREWAALFAERGDPRHWSDFDHLGPVAAWEAKTFAWRLFRAWQDDAVGFVLTGTHGRRDD